MAARTFPVRFALTATDQASGVFEQFSKNAQRAAKQAKKAAFGPITEEQHWLNKADDAQALASFGKSTAKAGALLTAGVTAPIVALGVASSETFAEFQKGIGNVGTLPDMTAESTKRLSDEVIALGKRTPVVFADLTAALYDIRSSGVSAADSVERLDEAARLGVAGLGSTQQAANLTTAAIKDFHLEGEAARNASNLLFQTVGSGKTTLAEMANGFAGTAASAHAAGGTLEDLLATTAALTSSNLPAAEAYTKIRSAIAGLTRENKDFAPILKKLGAESFRDLVEKSGGLAEAFVRVKAETKGAKQLLDIVGSEEGASGIELITSSINSQRDALAHMRSGVDDLSEAYRRQREMQWAKDQERRNRLDAAMIDIGEREIRIKERLYGVLDSLIGKWDGLSSESKDAIMSTAGLLAVGGPLMVALGGVLATVGSISAAFAGMKAAAAMEAATAASAAAASGTAVAAPAAGSAAAKLAAVSSGAAVAGVAAGVAVTGVALTAAIMGLNSELRASGGIKGTAAKMLEMGTMDPFKAHDAILNAKAIAKADAGGAHVTIDFKNVPKGVDVKATGKGGKEPDINIGKALP